MLTTWNIIWNLIDFLVLVFLLVKFLKAPVQKAIVDKQTSIASRLDDIESKLSSATDKLNSQNKQLEEIKEDLKKIDAQAQNMASKLYDETVKSAHTEAERVKEQMKKAMDQELNRAKAELRKEFVDKALVKSQEIISQKLDNKTQIGLIQGFAMSLTAKSSDN